MQVELLKATRGVKGSTNGLITFRIEVPIYIWTEILTHRRASRNASSARAMSTDRYVDMGHYSPPIFYQKGSGMKSADKPIKYQWLARLIWNTSFTLDVWAAKALEQLGVAKEQRNRVIAPMKYIAGIVTMTENGWKHFLSLRTAPNADKAMQELAHSIKSKISAIGEPNSNYVLKWNYSDWHIPYDPGNAAGGIHDRCMIAAAKISRLSYNRIEGKDDRKSAQRLLEDKHLSPFEHIAHFELNPGLSALFCKENDAWSIPEYVTDDDFNYSGYEWLFGYGWKTYRGMNE